MSPQDAATFAAIFAIVKEIGKWPILTVLLLVIIGPWIATWWNSRTNEKRHAAVVQMYQDNVKLVESYEKVAEGLQDIIVLSTQTMTQVRDRIDANLFCPLMRKDAKVEKTVEKP